MLVSLAGGVGAAKFLLGLSQVVGQEGMSVIVNTGDDIKLHGLHISPDIDTILYTLAGVAHSGQGWGLEGDTFNCLQALGRFGHPSWFRLGDRDLATHLHRTALLQQGLALSAATSSLCQAWGVAARILPMTDAPMPTRVQTPHGTVHFQEYLIRDGGNDEVRGVLFEAADQAPPAPGVLEALGEAGGIIVCPSNPIISIGPILAVPEIRAALRQRRDRVIAISPLVAGRALKGPTELFMRGLGVEVSSLGIATLYQDIARWLVIDHTDSALEGAIRRLGMEVVVTRTVMTNLEEKIALAAKVVAVLTSTEEAGK